MTSDREHFCPPDETTIWRYMRFDRNDNIRMLLCDNRLYFQRIERLRDEDPFEGRFTEPEVRGLFDGLRSAPDVRARQEFIDSAVKTLLLGEDLVKDNVVACWHIAEHENYAMWKIYVPAQSDSTGSMFPPGIAIRSTVGRAREAFAVRGSDPQIYAVKYIDEDVHIDESWDGGRALVFRKRRAYSYEQELRMLVFHPSDDKTGVAVDVDAVALVESIRVHPRATPAQLQQVRQLVAEAGVRCPVDISPVYSPADLATMLKATTIDL